MRLIDADALFRAMEETGWYNNADRDEIAEELVLKAPTIEPERKKGKWERHYCEDGNPDGWRCDNCDEWYYFGQTLPNFCPNCGADMMGENDDIPIEYFESGGI